MERRDQNPFAAEQNINNSWQIDPELARLAATRFNGGTKRPSRGATHRPYEGIGPDTYATNPVPIVGSHQQFAAHGINPSGVNTHSQQGGDTVWHGMLSRPSTMQHQSLLLQQPFQPPEELAEMQHAWTLAQYSEVPPNRTIDADRSTFPQGTEQHDWQFPMAQPMPNQQHGYNGRQPYTSQAALHVRASYGQFSAASHLPFQQQSRSAYMPRQSGQRMAGFDNRFGSSMGSGWPMPRPEAEGNLVPQRRSRSPIPASVNSTRQKVRQSVDVQSATSALGEQQSEKPKRKARRQQRTVRQHEYVQANYTCVLVRYPEVVREWWQAGYGKEKIQRLQQYLVQIAQVHGFGTVDRIVRRRHGILPSSSADRRTSAIGNDNTVVDPLDARVVFSATAGDPPIGYTPAYVPAPLAQPSTVARQRTNSGRGKTLGESQSFPRSNEPLPIGTSLFEIATRYPNHWNHEHLDAFLQHRVPPAQIWELVPRSVAGSIEGTGNTNWSSVMTARFRTRTALLCDIYGSGHYLDFIQSGFKLRELGGKFDILNEISVEQHIPPLPLAQTSDEERAVKPCLVFRESKQCPQHPRQPDVGGAAVGGASSNRKRRVQASDGGSLREDRVGTERHEPAGRQGEEVKPYPRLPSLPPLPPDFND